MSGGQVQEAISVYLRNIEDHPGSWTSHENLVSAYLFLGQREKAIQSVRRALELYPDNVGARLLLDGLEED